MAEKHRKRTSKHTSSKKSKNPCGLLPHTPELQVGDLVYLISDKKKSQSRDRYIIVKVDGPWCFAKKFRRSQLRGFSYKVRLSDCYAVPPSNVITSRPTVPPPQDDDDIRDHTNADRSPDPVPLHPLPPALPEITNPFKTTPSDPQVHSSISFESSPGILKDKPDCSSPSTNDRHLVLSPPANPEGRPQRDRKPPQYPHDYVRY